MLGALCGMCTPCEAPMPLGAPVPRYSRHGLPMAADGSFPMVVTADGDLSVSLLEDDLRASGYPLLYQHEDDLRTSGYPLLYQHENDLPVGRYGRYHQESIPLRRAQPVYVTPDGDILTPDGSVVTSDGTLVRSDGCLVRSDGTVITADGATVGYDSDNNNYLEADPGGLIMNDPDNHDDNGVSTTS